MKILEKIKNYLIKNWIYALFYVILILLLVFFVISKENKLILGGAILILTGAKYLLELNHKEKKFNIFNSLMGFSGIYMGIVSLLAKILLPNRLDQFIFIIIIVFVIYSIVYNLFMDKISLLFQIFSFLILLGFAGIVTISIIPVMDFINSEGFSNIYFYFAVVFFILFSVIIYFSLLRTFFNLIKKFFLGDISYLNNYLYLSLAFMFLTLFCGYHYLVTFSENKLRDFLLILSLAFINNFAAISALKSITKILEKS